MVQQLLNLVIPLIKTQEGFCSTPWLSRLRKILLKLIYFKLFINCVRAYTRIPFDTFNGSQIKLNKRRQKIFINIRKTICSTILLKLIRSWHISQCWLANVYFKWAWPHKKCSYLPQTCSLSIEPPWFFTELFLWKERFEERFRNLL